MLRTRFAHPILWTHLFLWTHLVATATSQDAAPEPPNVLLILADDMGYGDLGCTGSKTIATPHLDALAQSGVLCTQGYVASPVCSPSRAGLLTGRDPRRFGYEGNLNMGAARYATRPELLGLPPSEWTLGDHLRAAGYATALVGKWHQGTTPGFHPQKRGFDHFCGMLGGSHGYFPTATGNKLERNGKKLTEFSSPYLTDFFADEALRWLGARSEKKPWFLFLSFNAPHTPMHATQADLQRHAHIGDKRRRTYAAMVHGMDRAIGRVLDHLVQTKQRDNTLVVFLSDNGGATGNASWNGILSGAKGCLREGGVRVPFVWSWPARLPSGKTVDAPISALDLLPTFTAAAGAKPLRQKPSPSHEDRGNRRRYAAAFGTHDGVNLLPVLAGRQPAAPRTLFWRLQGQAAVLEGGRKLIRLSHRPAQLFAPGTDPGERSDLVAAESDATRRLFRQLATWESLLPTVPLWGSSPRWSASSAKIYDGWAPRPEPK